MDSLRKEPMSFTVFHEHTEFCVHASLASINDEYNESPSIYKSKEKDEESLVPDSRKVGRPYPRQSSEGSFGTQLISNEALGFENMSIHDSHESRTGNRGASHGGNSNLAGHQDDVDPDNMTYQQMSELGQTVGSVSKGLSKEQISLLPTHKYKGSSKKKGTSEDNNTECVICKAEYGSGDTLMTLPCAHQYHLACIKGWLKENKTCCICKEEVAQKLQPCF